MAWFALIWLVLFSLRFITCTHEVQISNSTLPVVIRALALEVPKGSVHCFCNSKMNQRLLNAQNL